MSAYKKFYISHIEKTNKWHRSHYIIHRDGWYFAEFKTEKQFNQFCDTVGIHPGKETDRIFDPKEKNLYIAWESDREIEEHHFYFLSDLPADAKPIKGLSNGYIVTCYFLNDGKTLHFYRPNPNASEFIYDPLPLEQHIAYTTLYGSY